MARSSPLACSSLSPATRYELRWSAVVVDTNGAHDGWLGQASSRGMEAMSPRKHTDPEIRESYRRAANSARDTADELARWRGGCDDPHHPWMPLGEGQQLFRDWREFT